MYCYSTSVGFYIRINIFLMMYSTLKKKTNQLSVTVYCDRKSRVYQSHSLWVRSALTFEVSHSECNGGEEAGHKNSHKNRGSRGRRGRRFSQLQSRRDMVLVKNKTNNMQVTNHDSEDLFCSRSTGYFFFKHFNIFIRFFFWCKSRKFVVSIIVFCFILPCKRPVFSHLVFDLLTVEDVSHRSQCCCRNTKYFSPHLFCCDKTKMCKNVHVASEWISMLTVITGNQQFVATLMKQQTAVWCLTPGCRRSLNEAFGLLLKRKICF